ncbi:hypothetical protein DPMN_182055 [Dreissena polymorpha]|uniref:Uncharacterized protein n=1 Tax=Dreissena polymorpha TaxID=45954 RepID=A0A9D4I5U3_DREPO|nr:hypothetical protein DPMN_182055 [Dreissena polymorpha]
MNTADACYVYGHIERHRRTNEQSIQERYTHPLSPGKPLLGIRTHGQTDMKTYKQTTYGRTGVGRTRNGQNRLTDWSSDRIILRTRTRELKVGQINEVYVVRCYFPH